MNLSRAIDPFTTTVAITVASVFVVGYAVKTKSEAGIIAAIAMALLATYRWAKMNEEIPVLYNDEGYEKGGNWYSVGDSTASVLQKVPMAAEYVLLDESTGAGYQLKRGTNARITATGEIRSYSPISELINGYTDKAISYEQ